LSSGAQAAEAFFQQGVELRARAFEGALAELTSAQARGAGLRTFGGGRMGFASTSDLGEESLRRLVKMALEVQAHTDPDAFAGLPEATIETDGAAAAGELEDGRIDWRAGARERSRLALELDARATSCRPIVRRTAGGLAGGVREPRLGLAAGRHDGWDPGSGGGGRIGAGRADRRAGRGAGGGPGRRSLPAPGAGLASLGRRGGAQPAHRRDRAW